MYPRRIALPSFLVLASLVVACSSRPPTSRGPAADGTGAIPWTPGMNNHGTSSSVGGGDQNSPGTPVAGACSLRLDQVPVGGGYSVSQLLSSQGYYGSFTGNWMYDQQILRAWVFNSAPGSSVFDAAKNTRAWFRAMQYVNGNNSQLWGSMNWQDYMAGAKMTAVLVSMMAVSRDPECVRLIRQYAEGMLGAYAKELDEIPFVAAAELVRDKQIETRFGEIETSREKLQREILQQEKVIVRKERESERGLKRLKSELSLRYRELAYSLRAIPSCRKLLAAQALTKDGDDDPREAARDVVADCEGKLEDRLGNLHDRELTLVTRLKRIEERGGAQDFPGSEKSQLQARLEEVRKSTRETEGYLAQLRQAGPESITGKIQALDEILERKKKLESDGAVAAEVQKKKEIEQRLEQLTPRWLTYGYFGGFPKASSGAGR